MTAALRRHNEWWFERLSRSCARAGTLDPAEPAAAACDAIAMPNHATTAIASARKIGANALFAGAAEASCATTSGAVADAHTMEAPAEGLPMLHALIGAAADVCLEMLPHEAATFLNVLTMLCLVALGFWVAWPRVVADSSYMAVYCAITIELIVCRLQSRPTKLSVWQGEHFSALHREDWSVWTGRRAITRCGRPAFGYRKNSNRVSEHAIRARTTAGTAAEGLVHGPCCMLVPRCASFSAVLQNVSHCLLLAAMSRMTQPGTAGGQPRAGCSLCRGAAAARALSARRSVLHQPKSLSVLHGLRCRERQQHARLQCAAVAGACGQHGCDLYACMHACCRVCTRRW